MPLVRDSQCGVTRACVNAGCLNQSYFYSVSVFLLVFVCFSWRSLFVSFCSWFCVFGGCWCTVRNARWITRKQQQAEKSFAAATHNTSFYDDTSRYVLNERLCFGKIPQNADRRLFSCTLVVVLFVLIWGFARRKIIERFFFSRIRMRLSKEWWNTVNDVWKTCGLRWCSLLNDSRTEIIQQNFDGTVICLRESHWWRIGFIGFPRGAVGWLTAETTMESQPERDKTRNDET